MKNILFVVFCFGLLLCIQIKETQNAMLAIGGLILFWITVVVISDKKP